MFSQCESLSLQHENSLTISQQDVLYIMAVFSVSLVFTAHYKESLGVSLVMLPQHNTPSKSAPANQSRLKTSPCKWMKTHQLPWRQRPKFKRPNLVVLLIFKGIFIHWQHTCSWVCEIDYRPQLQSIAWENLQASLWSAILLQSAACIVLFFLPAVFLWWKLSAYIIALW